MEIVRGSFCIQLTAETQGLSSKVHSIGTTEPMRPGSTSAQTSRFISTSKEPVCPQVELILKIIIILLIIFLGFIKSKHC